MRGTGTGPLTTLKSDTLTADELVTRPPSESNLSIAVLLLRYRVDRREAPDLHRYHHEFVVEHGEHVSGAAGLLHTRLETPVAGGDGALPRRHPLLVVRWT